VKNETIQQKSRKKSKDPWDHYEQIFNNKSESLEKMGKLLDTYNQPK
jgi:hypothetical protein